MAQPISNILSHLDLKVAHEIEVRLMGLLLPFPGVIIHSSLRESGDTSRSMENTRSTSLHHLRFRP